MKFVEKLKSLSYRARLAAYLQAVYFFGESMGEVFFNVFLWRSTGLIKPIAVYNFYYWAVLILGFVLIGYGFKKKGMAQLFRISFLLRALFYGLILVLREQAGDLVIWLGMLGGIAAAFYWAAHQVMVFSGTSDDTREMFYGVAGSLTAVVYIVGPVLAGWLIWFGSKGGETNLSGYYLVFGLLALVFLASELLIKQTRDVSFEKFSLKGTLSLFKERPVWRLNLWRSFIDGLMIPKMFLWAVIAFVILKNELWLGAVMGVFAALAALSNPVIGALFKPRLRKLFSSMGAGLLVIADVVYPWRMDSWGLIINQVFGEVIGWPLFSFTWIAFYFLSIEIDKEGEKRQFEYFTSHEIWQGAGRLLSIGVFILLVNQANQLMMARWWFGGLSLLYIVIWRLVMKIRQVLIQQGYSEEG